MQGFSALRLTPRYAGQGGVGGGAHKGPKLSAAELGQVIKLVGRSPRVYPPGTLDVLKSKEEHAITGTDGREPPAKCSGQRAGRR